MSNDILGKILSHEHQACKEFSNMSDFIEELKVGLTDDEVLWLELVFLKWQLRKQRQLVMEIKEEVHGYVLAVDSDNEGLENYPF